eukprot:scaffold1722_cov380-Prasinococcus_capsulatus_cf.AAC.1
MEVLHATDETQDKKGCAHGDSSLRSADGFWWPLWAYVASLHHGGAKSIVAGRVRATRVLQALLVRDNWWWYEGEAAVVGDAILRVLARGQGQGFSDNSSKGIAGS